jgi:ubiquinone/menaquinone biosynthesis C-methylase UbiE
MTNLLSTAEPWDLVADGYEEMVKPVFEKWARDSVERMALKATDTVLDVACGPGTVALLVAPMVKSVTALDFSSAMIAKLNAAMAANGITNVTARTTDCTALDYPNNSFDAAFSQFGLMFFPNRPAGFDEIFRVLNPGGRAAIYSWAPLSDSPAMNAMIGALNEAFPETRPDPDKAEETIVTGLDDPAVFEKEMADAGFRNVTIEAIRHHFPVKSPRLYWEGMVRGSAPVTMMQQRTIPAVWAEKSAIAIGWLERRLEPDCRALHSTAYLGIGTKPRG